MSMRLLEGLEFCQRGARAFAQPLLLLHGDADVLTALEGSQLFLEQAARWGG